jgi:hypothetical protein
MSSHAGKSIPATPINYLHTFKRKIINIHLLMGDNSMKFGGVSLQILAVAIAAKTIMPKIIFSADQALRVINLI